MKGRKSKFVLFFLMVLAVSLIVYKAVADDKMAPAAKGGDMKAMDPKMAAMMEKMQAYATPNENHKALEPLAGSWTYTLSMWMSPGATPETSTGASESSWIMGGRFLEQKVSGTSMGQPFDGMGIIGYDNIKKTYQTLWLDNMGTGMMMGTSQFDVDKKVLSEQGHMTCPITNGDRTYRTTATLKDADHYTYEMFMSDPDSGKEYKAMEIDYTKKK